MPTLAASLALAPLPAPIPDRVPPAVAQALATAGPGARIGLLVVDDAGVPIVAQRADERFVPASNTKLFTTAAAFATLDVSAPDRAAGAGIRLEPTNADPDVVLVGAGDARLSSAPDCRDDCLATLARAVAARTRIVHDVVGDDSAFPDERWPLGMGWNNMAGPYGTAISALTIDDNVVHVTVRPSRPGLPPAIESDGYMPVDDRAVTGAPGTASTLRVSRDPTAEAARIEGAVPADGPSVTLALGIGDPAHRAAWRLVALLRAEGVDVSGGVRVRHRIRQPWDDPAARGTVSSARPPRPVLLAQLEPAPLADDIRLTNKTSQNLHGELLLRRLGMVAGAGSVADGHAIVDGVLARAGIAHVQYALADGAGMSTYNRVTPAATVALLRWAGGQPWGAAWRATLPVAGTDGTLRRRFVGTPLAGHLAAKTGTLNAAIALSGYFTAASGRTFTFAAFANDMADDSRGAAALDAALLAIAAAH